MRTTNIFVTEFITDSYAGNFERELASFVTGLEFPRGAEYAEMLDSNDRYLDPTVREWWMLYNYEYNYENDDYPEAVSIWPSEDYFNNGRGQYFKIGERVEDLFQGREWPAYFNVAIFSSKEPADDILEKMWERAQDFPSAFKSARECSVPNIIGMRLSVIEPAPITLIKRIK
jgi:hypothetical protein